MLTEVEDVNVDILLSLPWSDLQNYCNTNQQFYHFCHHNKRLQYKIRVVSEMVHHVINEHQTLYPTMPINLEDFRALLDLYDIFIPVFKKSSINQEYTIMSLKIFQEEYMEYNGRLATYTKIQTGNYIIKVYMQANQSNMTIITSSRSVKILNNFLFNVLYDNIFFDK